ncbi:MAG: hypothetical protein K2M77_07235 [Muribaculaceae bacterium]|nr:hypothetical protein [Muribaculaceae bacterium]
MNSILKSFAAALLIGAPTVINAATVTFKDGNISYAEKTPWGDIDIDFARCMANKLYTFSSVSIDGVEVNHTESDNIGPFLIDQKGWSGGNHLNGDRLSAHTLGVKVYVDGRELTHDCTVDGKVLTVEVSNQLLHPSDDSDLARENVVYTVSGNSIDVKVSHEFQCAPETIERYYGMQSMFVNEFETLTPGGAFSTWTTYPVTSTGNELKFTKSSAPGFTTFIEHSKNGYQAAHMTADGLGDRHMVRDDDIIFIGNSWTKTYHKIIGMQPVKAGDRFNWHGIYSWFREPISDNCRTADGDRSFEYGAYIDGSPCLFHLNPDGTLQISNL